MGIQINGNTDSISASDGGLSISGADIGSASASSLNISGIVTATGGLNVGAGGTVITTTAGGFVGVGTDDPQIELQVNQSGGIQVVNNSEIALRYNAYYDGSNDRYIQGENRASSLVLNSGEFRFYTTSDTSSSANSIISGWNERIRVQSNGVTIMRGNSADWSTTTQGPTAGSLHFDPENTTDNFGNAITFGASDHGNGESAQAGIYVRSDGTYGTEMYLSTTDRYVDGAKTSIGINHLGYVTKPRQPYIFGSPTNTTGGGIFNSFHTVSNHGLAFVTDRITVPIAGVYLITFNTIMDTGTGRLDSNILINGTLICNQLSNTEDNGFRYRGASIAIKLSANDYIQFDADDWYNSTVTGFDAWRTASIVLLG